MRVPEALEYIKKIKIKREWLGSIEELCQDGGSFIWLNIIPHWSGYTDDFIIRSVEDTFLLPNLKKIILFYNENNPDILDEFKERGVEIKWI